MLRNYFSYENEEQLIVPRKKNKYVDYFSNFSQILSAQMIRLHIDSRSKLIFIMTGLVLEDLCRSRTEDCTSSIVDNA